METSVPGLLLYRDFISSSLEEELITEIDAHVLLHNLFRTFGPQETRRIAKNSNRGRKYRDITGTGLIES